MDIYFILHIIIKYNSFSCSNCSTIWQSRPLLVAPMTLWHISIVGGLLLLLLLLLFILALPCLLALQDSLGNVVYFLPQSQSQPFSMEPWFPSLVSGIRNYDVGAGCACCYWGLTVSGLLSWQSKEIYVCILTCTYTHLYKDFYMEASPSVLS